MRSCVTFIGRFFPEPATTGAAAPTDCSMRPEYLVAAVDREGGEKGGGARGSAKTGGVRGKSAGREREEDEVCRVAGVALEIY